MKVWVEWKLCQNCDISIGLRRPNVFMTKENLVEFWKRVRFPADTVDWLFGLADKSGKTEIEYSGWCAAEVEVDEFFVKKRGADEQGK